MLTVVHLEVARAQRPDWQPYYGGYGWALYFQWSTCKSPGLATLL